MDSAGVGDGGGGLCAQKASTRSKNRPTPRTILSNNLWLGPAGVDRAGGLFLMSEIHLYVWSGGRSLCINKAHCPQT